MYNETPAHSSSRQRMVLTPIPMERSLSREAVSIRSLEREILFPVLKSHFYKPLWAAQWFQVILIHLFFLSEGLWARWGQGPSQNSLCSPSTWHSAILTDFCAQHYARLPDSAGDHGAGLIWETQVQVGLRRDTRMNISTFKTCKASRIETPTLLCSGIVSS